MNKKDVLGLRLLPGITWKMESTPRWVKTRFCAKSGFCFSLIKCLFGGVRSKFPDREFTYFSSMFVVFFTGNWIYKLVAFLLCSISKWYQMLHRQHFVKYFYFTPIMLFSISCVQSINKTQYLVSIPIVQYRTIHNI